MKHITNYKPKDFAELLNVSVKTLQRWDRDGVLKLREHLQIGVIILMTSILNLRVLRMITLEKLLYTLGFPQISCKQ